MPDSLSPAGVASSPVTFIDRFDDSDVNGLTVNDVACYQNSYQLSHIIAASLIELICNNPKLTAAQQKKLFKMLSSQVIENGGLDPFYCSDVFAPVRPTIISALSSLVAENLRILKLANGESGDVAELSSRFLQTSLAKCLVLPKPPAKLLLGPAEWLPMPQFRYQRDFEELSCIGEGGFARVFKVINKLDQCVYAVKEIKFDVVNFAVYNRVRREVMCLANLRHPNIVRYYGAWLDLMPSPENSKCGIIQHVSSSSCSSAYDGSRKGNRILNCGDLKQTLPSGVRRIFSSPEISFLTDSNDNGREHLNTRDEHADRRAHDATAENPPLVQFACTSDLEESLSQPLGRFGSNICCGKLFEPTEVSSLPRRFSRAGSHGSHDVKALIRPVSPDRHSSLMNTDMTHWYLYIQMEFCSSNLREWLNVRNSSISADVLADVDTQKNVHISAQLLTAIAFIHEKGIIHRDIKVLVGDFGLSSYAPVTSACAALPASADVIDLPDHRDSATHDAFAARLLAEAPSLSRGIGTLSYAAPEQLESNSRYDNTVDIFSLGIIFFELYQPFRTYMERINAIIALRNDSFISEDFQSRWPVETDLIKRMTLRLPSGRPSSSQLLKSSLFCRTDDTESLKLKSEIESLKLKVEQLQSELGVLRSRNDFVENTPA